MEATEELFAPVVEALDDAVLVAWDGCHKIYLACDDNQAAWFAAEYPHIDRGSNRQMLYSLTQWWALSCSLRFISAVVTNHDDPNAGYTTLIPQFAEEEE